MGKTNFQRRKVRLIWIMMVMVVQAVMIKMVMVSVPSQVVSQKRDDLNEKSNTWKTLFVFFSILRQWKPTELEKLHKNSNSYMFAILNVIVNLFTTYRPLYTLSHKKRHNSELKSCFFCKIPAEGFGLICIWSQRFFIAIFCLLYSEPKGPP